MIFSLQIGLLYFGGELDIKVVEQDLLVVGGARDAAVADFDAVTCRQNYIHQTDFAQFGKDTRRGSLPRPASAQSWPSVFHST